MSVQNQNQEIQIENTLFAEPVFHVGQFTITNSMLTSWIAMFALVILFVYIGKKIKKVPRGIQNIFEFILEGALDLADSVTNSRKKTEKILPVALAIFFFVLANNWLGLLPGVGTVGFVESEGGHNIFLPLFRSGTADLNTTLALSLFAVILSHIFGVFSIGIWNHINKFINIKTFLAIPSEVRKDVSVIFVNPIKAFVGILEIIGELAKIASLSFRLFGNIFAGEVLLASMMAISAYILPVPFMFLEILVGVIQALIFAMLTMVFMTMASTAEEH